MHRGDGPARHRGGRADAAARARHASARGEGFGRFVGVTALSLVPGAGLIAAGRRLAGGLLLGLTVLVIAGAGLLALRGDVVARVLTASVQPRTLLVAAVTIAVIASACSGRCFVRGRVPRRFGRTRMSDSSRRGRLGLIGPASDATCPESPAGSWWCSRHRRVPPRG